VEKEVKETKKEMTNADRLKVVADAAMLVMKTLKTNTVQVTTRSGDYPECIIEATVRRPRHGFGSGYRASPARYGWGFEQGGAV